MTGLWQFLHLFFAFSFVGGLVVADWNGRAARATNDWGQRAVLFQIIHLSGRVAVFGGLVLLGVFGNLLSVSRGYSMGADVWLRWVNGLWLVMLVVTALITLPNAAHLATASRLAAGGGQPDGYAQSLVRWRIGNILLSVLYVAMLVLMVFHWHS